MRFLPVNGCGCAISTGTRKLNAVDSRVSEDFFVERVMNHVAVDRRLGDAG